MDQGKLNLKKMILYEFEGKEILRKGGIRVPKPELVFSPTDKINLEFPLMLKAQILSGKRKISGGVVSVSSEVDLRENLRRLFENSINGEKIKSVLAEEKIEHDKENEYYLSFSYDSAMHSPILSFSEKGGVDIEREKSKFFPASPLNPSFPDIKIPKQILKSLADIFFENDCLLLEINPLIEKDDKWFALDAKIKLDDSALSRHGERNFPARGVPGREATGREIMARKIDESDHRGTAGSSYFDMDGDIAILASGGGASLVAMDAFLNRGAKPANYTEYSGNPPKEKVEKLTEIVLSKPNIHGLWVGGAVANFTDIFETMTGFIEGLRNVEKKTGKKISFPIVIRRGGPRDKKAFDFLSTVKDFDLHVFGQEISITRSAEIMADLAKKYVASK